MSMAQPPAADRERPGRMLVAFQNVLTAVLAMHKGDDIEIVLPVIWNELRALDVDLLYCGLGLVDARASTFQYFGFTPQGILRSRMIPLADAMRGSPPGFWGGVARRPVGGPVVVHRQVSSQVIVDWFEHLNRCGGQVEGFDTDFLPEELEAAEVPFADGFLIVSRQGAPFAPDELDIFARIADLFSVGYARFLDFERLERQNRALLLTSAVDLVQQAVGKMERSHDWGRVVGVLGEQLRALGVRFNGVSINAIDESTGLFRQNMVWPRAARELVAAGSKPPQLVAEVDGGHDLWCVDRPLEPGRVPSRDAYAAWSERRVLVRRMDEEERDRRFQRGMKVLGYSPDNRDQFPRSTLDVPFSQGLIALTSPFADAFSDEDVEVVREFAKVIETGYRRWMDFRQLERTNRELMEAHSQLVQSAKMAAMGELVAGVAHEINTPLGAIKSTTDVLDRIMERLEPAVEDGEKLRQARELLGLNQSSVERISSIVRDLRDFARLDEAEFQEADLHQGISSTLNLIRHETRDRIEVVLEFGDLPRIRCYPNRLNQVFMNVFKNALQAIDGHGSITIRTSRDRDRVRITVSDDGRGIPDENLPRIFDPGFTTKGVGVGTGLGLAISARIMEEHGGQIAVESRVDQGTTLTLELPVHPPVGKRRMASDSSSGPAPAERSASTSPQGDGR
jgi:signal transduction histidine kinase